MCPFPTLRMNGFFVNLWVIYSQPLPLLSSKNGSFFYCISPPGVSRCAIIFCNCNSLHMLLLKWWYSFSLFFPWLTTPASQTQLRHNIFQDVSITISSSTLTGMCALFIYSNILVNIHCIWLQVLSGYFHAGLWFTLNTFSPLFPLYSLPLVLLST